MCQAKYLLKMLKQIELGFVAQCFSVVPDCIACPVYALLSWGGFHSAELNDKVDAML